MFERKKKNDYVGPASKKFAKLTVEWFTRYNDLKKQISLDKDITKQVDDMESINYRLSMFTRENKKILMIENPKLKDKDFEKIKNDFEKIKNFIDIHRKGGMVK